MVYREITRTSILLGLAQGIVLNIAFVYIALKLGFSMPGSTIAAIMGYVVLRGILRKGTIAENNINQTLASGINSAGTGVVFVLPALFLVGSQNDTGFSFWPLILAGIGGALIGVVLIIPLRKQLIEIERLRFPTGMAVATIIRSGSAGVEKAKLLVIGVVIAVLWKLLLLSQWLELTGVVANEELSLSFGVFPAYLNPALSLSLLNIAAGMLVGRMGLPFFFGGLIAWWCISPMAVVLDWTPPELTGQALADFVYEHMLRPLGIGMLIGAALMEVVMNYPAIKSATLSLLAASAQHSRSKLLRDVGREEMPFWLLLAGGIAALVLLFLSAFFAPGVTVSQALLAAVLGTLWMGVAGLIVAQASGLTDISPISGMTLISVTLLMMLFANNAIASIIIAVGVGVAIGQAADMMQDLKTGFLVGSRPFLQQIIQFSLSWIGVLVAFGVIYILWKAAPMDRGGSARGRRSPRHKQML